MGPQGYEGFHISHDAKRLYFFTDQDQGIYTPRAYLDFQDPTAKMSNFVKMPVGRSIQDLFSKDDKVEVVTRDSDGIGAMTIYDAATQKKLNRSKTSLKVALFPICRSLTTGLSLPLTSQVPVR